MLRHLAIILHAYLGQILQSLTGDPLVGVYGLFLGQRDAQRLDAAAGCGDDHRSPSATDIEQSFAWLQIQLVENQAQLVGLCVFKAHMLVVEHRAGVGHGRT